MKFLKLRVEVEVVDFARQVLRGVQLLFDERPIYKELGTGFVDLEAFPGFDLAAHGLEMALHAVDAYRQRIDQAEFFECLASTGVKSPRNAMLSQTKTR